MLQLLTLALAFVTTSPAPSYSSPPPVASSAIAATDSDPFAELIGKAVVVWCRPSSLKHGITLLDRSWSIDGDFRSLNARFRWFGLWSKTPYTSSVKIDVFLGGDAPKVTSIEYDDNCLTPCEMCKKMGGARALLNRKIKEALD